MSADINLASTENKQSIKIEHALLIIRIAAVVAAIFVLASASIVFILNLTNPMSSIKNQQNQVLQNLNSYKNKSGNYNLLNERLRDISMITLKRTDYTEQLNKIVSLIGSDTSADTLTIVDNKFTLGISSTSLLSISHFLDAVFDVSDKSKTFTNLNIDSLTTNVGTGNYSLYISGQIL